MTVIPKYFEDETFGYEFSGLNRSATTNAWVRNCLWLLSEGARIDIRQNIERQKIEVT